MGLEIALESLGRFGKYQCLIYCLIGLSCGLTSRWQLMSIIFIGYINPHHCSKKHNQTLNDSIPFDPETKTYSQCEMYVDRNISNATKSCDGGWTYSLDGFDHEGTITMEFDLVCNKDWWVELSQTLFNFGVVSGFLFFTPFGDKFGRKTIFFICQLLMSVFGIIMSFSVNFEMFCAFQFLTGACAAGLYLTGLVLACEMFPTSVRSTMAPATVMFECFGHVTLNLWAYLLRNWRHLQLGISVTGVCALIYYFWCPESLRWLLANGKVKEAREILERAARFNKKKLPHDLQLADDLPGAKVKVKFQSNIALLWSYVRNPKTLRYMLIMMYLVFNGSLMTYSLSLLMGALGGDLYLNFFISTMLELPSLILAIILMTFAGRRYPISFLLIFSSVSISIASICSELEFETIDKTWLVTGLAFVTKFGTGAANTIPVIYAQEILPTNIRITGLGLIGGAGFLGSLLAPYSVYLYRSVQWVPLAVFAVLTLIAGLLTLLLPETSQRDLPLTVEEIASWSLTLSDEEKKRFKDQKSDKIIKSELKEPMSNSKIERKTDKNGVATLGNSYTNQGFSENTKL